MGKQMSQEAMNRILELDPKATFKDDGSFRTGLSYDTLNDIFNYYGTAETKEEIRGKLIDELLN